MGKIKPLFCEKSFLDYFTGSWTYVCRYFLQFMSMKIFKGLSPVIIIFYFIN